jgi:tetratricopeptide (TPR) repeat protein
MQYQRWLAPVLLFVAVPHTLAQLHPGTGNVKVHIILEGDRHAGSNLLVRLMEGSSNAPVATTYTTDAGQAEFNGVNVGNYHIVVSGDGIQTADSGMFEVDTRRVTQTQYITVRKVDDPHSKPDGPSSATVSTATLNVPEKARKEFDKASDAMAHQDWNKAAERLNKAITVYPQYAAAYNNLGVVYSHLNDDSHEQEALARAIALDDHFAPAFMNFGKLRLRQKDFSQAEAMLEKAAALDPLNAQGLALLADAQYMNQHYDAALVSARQAHTAFPQHPSFVHYIAARAYQQEGRQKDALVELRLFLQEEPSGSRADYVRGDIARMQGSSQ